MVVPWRADTIDRPIRTDGGAVILPLPWSIAPPLAPRLRLPEVELQAKDELHLTVLSSAEAEALDAATGEPDSWRRLLADDPIEAGAVILDDARWLLRADKPEGRAWSVVAMARCPAFERCRARAASATDGAVAGDAPAHVTLYVAGDPRGIGLPSKAAFDASRVRRLSSLLDPDLIRAYRETEYRVHGTPGFVLRVDAASADLLALHARHRVTSSAFLTACNPYGRKLDSAENERRQRALAGALGARGFVCLPGIGQHPTGDWPGEDSILALGLRLDEAQALGDEFEQNAIVWAGADAVPRLILLR